MKKLFTFLTLLVFLGGGKSWGQKASQELPTTVLDVSNPTMVTTGTWSTTYASTSYYYSSTDKILVVSAFQAYQSKSNQTWTNTDSGNSSPATWSATGVFKGNAYYFGEGTAYSAALKYDNRNMNYLVTKCTEASALVANNSTKRSVSIAAYEATVSGTISVASTPSKTATSVVGSTAAQVISIDELDPSKNYLIVLYASDNNNAKLYEVAFSSDTRVKAEHSFASTSGNALLTDGTFVLPSLTSDPVIAGATYTYSSSDTDVASFADNSVGTVTLNAEGTTTITATYAGDEDYQPATATYELTVLAASSVLNVSTETTVALSQTNIEAQNYLNFENANYGETTISAVSESKIKYPNLSSSNRVVSVTVKGAKSFEVFLKNSNNDGRTYVVSVGGNASSTIYHQGKLDDTTTDVRSSGLIACPSDITTITIGGGGGNSVYAGYIVFYTTDVQTTISSAGYASFSNAGAVTIPSGITAYYASTAGDGNVTLKEIEGGVIPANTGVVLKGDAGTYSFAGTTTATTLDDNKLVANLTTLGTYLYETANSGEGYYTLAAGPKFMLSTGYTAETPSTFLAGGKAFLPKANVTDSTPARELAIDIEGISTGINMVNGEGLKVNGSETYYDLQGRRVLYPTKGLYIVNGKKVVIK